MRNRYIRNPSQWWDNRNSKTSPKYTDFKHKSTQQSSWIDGWYNHPWIREEILQKGGAEIVEGVEKENAIIKIVALLKACAKRKDLVQGTRLHSDISRSGLLETSPHVANSLVNMYAKCGALSKAAQVLDELPARDIVSWNALITGYTQNGCGDEALECFERLQCEGLHPDAVTFICILKACAIVGAAAKGKQIHDQVVRQGLLGTNPMLATALVDMYAKCGELLKAQQVLDELPERNVVTWSALISGYAQNGHGEEALSCFERMQHEGLCPDAVTFACILKACAILGAATEGKKIHDQIIRCGLLGTDVELATALVDMYAKCGELPRAQQVLDELPERNAATWTALITGYVQHGHGEEALSCFEQMQREANRPDAVTFLCVLKACAMLGAAIKGKQIHEQIVRQGLLGTNVVLATALIDMYAKCGALSKAQRVLNEFPNRNVVTWNALIAGYTQCGHYVEALNCLERMQHEGFFPNSVTFICILKACSAWGAANKGKQIHDQIVRQGLLGTNPLLATALVDMYAKCGELTKAQQVFDELPIRDVVTWSVLIAGYVQHGQGEKALNCFEKMQSEGLVPDGVTFVCILKACADMGAVTKGKQIHDQVLRQGLLGQNSMLCTALVDMYAKCGALSKAQGVLDELQNRNVLSWTALIAGYAQYGHCEEALSCFERMQHEGCCPDAVTLTCLLKACASVGAATKGKHIHDQIVRQGLLGTNIELGNALVDMYAKCGELEKAQEVLDELPIRDVVTWSALIAGYAQHGHSKEALLCFERMQHEGLCPNAVTIISVLSACSHSGLLDEAQKHFENMSTMYGIVPDLEHYTCMVDLFGRAGHFDKAISIIAKMPSPNYPPVWAALLGACRKWGNVKLGKYAFEHVVELDKADAAAYVV